MVIDWKASFAMKTTSRCSFRRKMATIHFFEKSELRTVQPLDQSLMPTNYSQRLSPDELNDLVSYLMNGVPEPGKPRSSHKPEDPEQ